MPMWMLRKCLQYHDKHTYRVLPDRLQPQNYHISLFFQFIPQIVQFPSPFKKFTTIRQAKLKISTTPGGDTILEPAVREEKKGFKFPGSVARMMTSYRLTFHADIL